MKKLLLLLPFVVLFLNVNAKQFYWSPTSGNWSAGSNWHIGGFGGISDGTHPRASNDTAFVGNGSANATITLDSSFSIQALFYIGSGQIFLNSSGKSLTISGDVNVSGNTNTTDGGTAVIRMTGGTLTGNAATMDVGKLPNIVFTSGSNVTLNGVITLGGSTTLTDSGTVNYGTSTFVFYYNTTVAGNLGLYNTIFQGNNGSFTINNTLTVNGNLRLLGTSGISLNTGTIAVYRNLVDSNSYGTSGSAILSMVGDSNATYTCVASPQFNFVVNKGSSAHLSPASGTTNLTVITFTLQGGIFTAPSGTLAIGWGQTYYGITLFNQTGGSYIHNSGTLSFNTTTSYNYSYAMSTLNTVFNNVTINCSTGGGFTVGPSGDTLKVVGTLSHQNSDLVGIIQLSGNLIVGAGAKPSLATIILNGSASTTYSNSVGGYTGQIIINKSTGDSVYPASGDTIFNAASLNILSGKFVAPTHRLTLGAGSYGNYTATSPIFNQALGTTFRHNNGTVEFTPYYYNGGTYTINTLPSTVFNNVIAAGSGYIGVCTLTPGTGDTVKISGTFTHFSGLLAGTWETPGNFIVGAAAQNSFGTIILDGAQSSTYNANPSGYTGIITVNKASGDSVYPASGDTALNTSCLNLIAGKFTAPHGTMIIGINGAYGNYEGGVAMFNQTGGTFGHNSGTVKFTPFTYSGATYTVAALSSTVFNNVIIKAGGYLANGTFAPATGDSIKVNNNFTHQAGVLNGVWEIGNNATISSSLNGGNAQFIFNGGNNQQLSVGSGITLNKIIMKKTAGTLTLNNPVTLTSNLTLTKGNIVTTSTNLLTITNGATVTGASDSSFISGPVKKVGNQAFTFPTGKGSYYNPIEITAPSSTSDAFTAEYFNTDTIPASRDTSLTYASLCEFWHLYHTAGSSTVKMKLYWNTHTCDIYTTSTLKIAYLNSSTWKAIASKVTSTSTTTSGKDSSTSALSSFGDFTIGKKSPAVFANAGSNQAYCFGGSATIGASPAATGGLTPYSYAWSPATGLNSTTVAQPTASPTPTTTYTLTVTDLDRSTATSTVVVNVSKPIAFAGRDTAVCSESSVTIGATIAASGGISPYTYSWSPAIGLTASTVANPVASPTITTNYILTVTDSNSCSAVDTVLVHINSKPSFTYLSLYSVLSGGNIIDTSANFGHGKIGAAGTVSTKIYAMSAVEQSGAGTVTPALAELNSTRSSFSNMIGKSLIPDSVGNHTFSCGVYNISSSLTLNKPITISGDTNAVFIFNINGSLVVDSGAKIILNGPLAKQVFFNVSGKLIINDSSVSMNGCFLTGDSTIIHKNVRGTFCILANASVILLGNNTLYQIGEMGYNTSFACDSEVTFDSVTYIATAVYDSSMLMTGRATILRNACSSTAKSVSSVPGNNFVYVAFITFGLANTDEDTVRNIVLSSYWGDTALLTAFRVETDTNTYLSVPTSSSDTDLVVLKSGQGALTSFYVASIPPGFFLLQNVNGSYSIAGLPTPQSSCPGGGCDNIIYTTMGIMNIYYYHRKT